MSFLGRRQYSFRVWLITAILCLLAIVAGWQLVGNSNAVLHWAAVQQETLMMGVEIGIVFLLLFFVLYLLKDKVRLFCVLSLILVFCYLHETLFPAVLSFLYLVFACMLGRQFRRIVCVTVSKPVLADSVIGYAWLIVLFALLSAFGVGEIRYLQIMVAGIACLLFLWELPKGKKQKIRWQFAYKKKGESACLALIGAMFLMEIGKMNISLDFDSLWYGVRSEYVLNAGGGIYENLGLMGVVYTYPKGLEIFTLPFSNLPSHSYLAFFGIWFALLGCYAMYAIACECLAEKKKENKQYKQTMQTKQKKNRMEENTGELLLPLLFATMPSVMNLTISVKTDTMTLMMQIWMLYYLIRYWKRQFFCDFLLAGCCLLLSWTLKPTGLLFSTAVFGMALLFFLYYRQVPRGSERIGRKLVFCVPVITALIAVCARTILLTGVPFTSIFTGIFTLLGFSLKYPFNVESVPYSAALLTPSEKLIRVGKRTLQLLFCPSDQSDMGHVVCAWGGLVLVLALALVLVSKRERGLQKTKEEKRSAQDKPFFLWMLIPLTLANLLSFWQLKQIDGNYYNFYYIIGLVASFAYAKRHKGRGIGLLAVPVVTLNILLCMVSSTSWQIGMTPISLKNQGYYLHETLEQQAMIEAGNQEIWNVLEENSRYRVIVIGEHPAMLAFPCTTQSYYDVAGSWGNKNLVRDVETFRTFLEFAKTDYIYIQANWMTTESESYTLVCELTKQGMLRDFLFENGNILARVDLDTSTISEEECQKNLYQLQNTYPFYVDGEEAGK